MSTEQRFTTASLDKALSICRTLDDHPEAWPLYGETITDYFQAVAATLQDHEQTFANLRGGGRRKSNGELVTVRARVKAVKERLWRTRLHRCETCGAELTWASSQPHHLMPISQGGNDDDTNLRLLCLNCHARAHEGEK